MRRGSVKMGSPRRDFGRVVQVILLLSCQTSMVFADTDVFQFLQEEAKVTTASKRAESIQDAPGIITVITSDEIRRYGARNLKDILDRAPSLYTLSSYLYPSNVVSIRGDSETHTDDHVLWLLNGRPVREPAFGGVNIDVITTFPVSMIDHLEIVRGPGSVLYGSNAYTGVINIITKQGHEKEGEVKAGGGSFDTGYGETLIQTPAKDGGIAASGRFYRSGGWLMSAKDESQRSDSVRMKEEDSSFALSSTYKDLTLNGFYANDHHIDMGPLPSWVDKSPTNTAKGMFDLGYKHEVIQNWSLGLNTTYNHNHIGTWYPAPYGSADRDATSILTEATLYGKPLENLNIILGGSGEYQEIVFNPEGITPNEVWWSFYSQADYRLNSMMKLLGGMQYNKPQGIPSNVSPRAGLITNFNSDWGSKLLYGQAFRAPYLAETRFNSPVLLGNPNLRPETIVTYEAQVFHQAPQLQTSFTYFHSKQNDRIGRAIVNGVQTFQNIGQLTSQGLELEGTYSATRNLSFTGSYTYQTNWDQSDVHDATFMPNSLLKTGVSYVADRGITTSLFNTYAGRRGNVNVVNPAALQINPPSSAYNWLTANVIFDLQKLVRKDCLSGFSVSLYAVNLLNEQVFDPEFNRKNIDTLPAAPGRSLYGEMRWKFM